MDRPLGATKRIDGLTWRLVACAALSACAGCTGGQRDVAAAGGTVALSDGSPLPGCWVTFRPEDAKDRVTARGQTGADGKFALTTFEPNDGALVGRHRAIVLLALGGDREGTPVGPRIDPRYNAYESSGLEFEVTDDPAKNQFAIVVEPAAQ